MNFVDKLIAAGYTEQQLEESVGASFSDASKKEYLIFQPQNDFCLPHWVETKGTIEFSPVDGEELLETTRAIVDPCGFHVNDFLASSRGIEWLEVGDTVPDPKSHHPVWIKQWG